MSKILNILVPMAGGGKAFIDAGFVFPKPIIDIRGKTMIEVVAENLRPRCAHRFIFVCQKEQCEKYDLYNILKQATKNNFEIVQLSGRTEGAACTVLTATQYINSDEDLIIANGDQFIETDINEFVDKARENDGGGTILTFPSSHPRWSYARIDSEGRVIETAEKKLISNNATSGIYYFAHGKDFVHTAQSMIKKNIRYNNEFYVCPVFNELILEGKTVRTFQILSSQMNGLGTPEDLKLFLEKIDKGIVKI